jgi:hypothetical protein
MDMAKNINDTQEREGKERREKMQKNSVRNEKINRRDRNPKSSMWHVLNEGTVSAAFFK